MSLREQVEAYYDNDGKLHLPKIDDRNLAPTKLDVIAVPKSLPNGTLNESIDWPEPQPITAKIQPESYPTDALPDVIRLAVEEVEAFVKAPIAIIASSALGSLSLACQSHVDVKRAEKLQGPSGLFLLTVADSGERKTTCDNFFTSAIKQYQDEQAEALKPALKKYESDLLAWQAERDGIMQAIKEACRKNKPTNNLKESLSLLYESEPEPPRIPRLLYADVTPEKLAYNLSKLWPSGGVVSNEAGIVFGSHGMGKDSLMKNLSQLNQLWDGNSLSIDRKTSDSFIVKGARLTVALQVQETTLKLFFDKSGELARGTGFLARFLISHPESTQGYRPFTEAPQSWPRLSSFNRRIAAILNEPVPIDADGALTPSVLELSPKAKAAWVIYHDTIEKQLASGGELYDVRDVASKAADNASRLAALFQWLDESNRLISLDAFERASRVVAWHLSESRRFFGELALPDEIADAARLDNWLIDYCEQGKTCLVGKNVALQYSPLRKKDKLDAAIRELTELDRLQVQKEGKRTTLVINPNLLNFKI